MTRDEAITLIEKTMLELPPKGKGETENPYLAGYIDALADTGLIDQKVRVELYIVYAEEGRIKGNENGPDISGIGLGDISFD